MVYMAFPVDSADANKNEKAPALIMSVSCDNSLRTIRQCEFAKAACNKLSLKCAKRTVTDEIGILNCLLSTKLQSNSNAENHVSLVQSHCSRLNSMGIEVQKHMKSEIQTSSLSNRK